MTDTPNPVIYKTTNLYSGLNASINNAHNKYNWAARSQKLASNIIRKQECQESVELQAILCHYGTENIKSFQMIIKTRLTKTLHISMKVLRIMHIDETIRIHCSYSNLIANTLHRNSKTALFQGRKHSLVKLTC